MSLKIWEIHPCTISVVQLQSIFPDAEIVGEELDTLPVRAHANAVDLAVDTAPKPDEVAAVVPGSLSVAEFVGKIRQLLTQAFSTVVVYGV